MRRPRLRRALLVAILLWGGIAGAGRARKLPSLRFDTADDAVVWQFAAQSGIWLRRRFGCNEPPAPAQDSPSAALVACWPAAGYRDTVQWRKARELAKTVFQLKD